MEHPTNPGADNAAAASQHPTSHTTSPIVTGASVLGVKYDGGVMVMADTLGSYGRLARFTGLQRILKVSEDTVIGASGEYSDLQYIEEMLRDLTSEDFAEDDGISCKPSEIYHYLARVLYYRRSKVNPLYNQIVVAGFRDSKPFLGYTDLYGSAFEEDIVATGFGTYMALPLLRKAVATTPRMSEADARKLLENCMRVLFYRDCNTINKFQIATVNDRGVTVSEPYSLETQWSFSRFQNPQSQD